MPKTIMIELARQMVNIRGYSDCVPDDMILDEINLQELRVVAVLVDQRLGAPGPAATLTVEAGVGGTNQHRLVARRRRHLIRGT